MKESNREPWEPTINWRGRKWHWEIGWCWRARHFAPYYKDYYDGWHHAVWIGPLYVYWGDWPK